MWVSDKERRKVLLKVFLLLHTYKEECILKERTENYIPVFVDIIRLYAVFELNGLI